MNPQTAMTVPEARRALAALRQEHARIALVPTLGALHEGHLALVARARELADAVVVSIFVNPLQFGPTEDLARYPRTPEQDLALLAEAGVALVFAPGVEAMYPDGDATTRVSAGPVGDAFEGAARPGHFDGVLTVVMKLLQIVGPDVVTFGRKDAQQAFLVDRMVRDLDVPTEVVLVDTVREPDGLARSSRNRYLTLAERALARTLPDALSAASAAAPDGVAAALGAAQAVLDGESGVVPGYFAIVDPATFRPVAADYRGPALALVAARVGATRLIDNAVLQLGRAPDPRRSQPS